METGKPAKRPENGRAKQGSSRSGRPESRAVSAGKPPPAGTSAGHAEKRAIHPPTRQAGLDTQAGQQGTQAAGSAGGRGSRGGRGGAKGDRTRVREPLCRTQLRIQTATRGQRRLATSGSTARHRESLGGGCRPQRLLQIGRESG